MASKQSQTSEGLVQLDPSVIMAEANSRYALKPLRVETLMNSILQQGGVQVPVEVEPLESPVNGFKYRLTTGFHRHEAVTRLNKDQGAGLKLPALVKSLGGDEITRLKRQLTENVERESLSPMDKAAAIDLLLKANVPMIEIRTIFSTPGGRKGLAVQPASNAHIRMVHSFLQLPKAIQNKIDSGLVGVGAAYELTKVTPEKQAAVLDRAEKDRIATLDREEADEKRFLDAEAKAAEARLKEEEAKQAADAAKLAKDAAEKEAEEKREQAERLYAAAISAKGEAKKAAKEAKEAAEADLKAAEKKLEETTRDVERAAVLTEKAAKLVAEKAAQLAGARKAAAAGGPGKQPKGQKNVSGGDIKKASVAEGANQQYVALNVAQVRAVIEDLCKPGVFPKVQEIGKIVRSCILGIITPSQMYSSLGMVTGEKKPTKAASK